jgi:hypothetical protein
MQLLYLLVPLCSQYKHVQSRIKWAPIAPSSGKLITHLHLVPRLRMSGPIHPLLHMPAFMSGCLISNSNSFFFRLYLPTRNKPALHCNSHTWCFLEGRKRISKYYSDIVRYQKDERAQTCNQQSSKRFLLPPPLPRAVFLSLSSWRHDCSDHMF